MKTVLRNALLLAGAIAAAQAAAQVTFYEREGYAGRSFATDRPVDNFARYGFNDRASSAVVASHIWEICEDARYGGRCMILRPGSYPSLAAMGLNDRVSSVRRVGGDTHIDDHRYAPAPQPVAEYEYRPRHNERLYSAEVTSVHAVFGPPEKRCWTEHKEVAQAPPERNIPGAIVGAVIGGILGHQLGSGRGNDVATAGGIVGGAVVGSNVGTNGRGSEPRTRDVERCTETRNDARPEFWDVTYNFRGQEHRVQLNVPPAATISVNERGEPRG